MWSLAHDISNGVTTVRERELGSQKELGINTFSFRDYIVLPLIL